LRNDTPRLLRSKGNVVNRKPLEFSSKRIPRKNWIFPCVVMEGGKIVKTSERKRRKAKKR
jgi:hypothetical protein